MNKKPVPKLSALDVQALAAFWAMHHCSIAMKDRLPGPRNIERIVMSAFGLVEKTGPYRLTARGKRALALAKS